MMKQFMAAALAVSLLAGCSFLDNHSATAKIATQYATIKVIDGDPGKAARVESIAAEVRSYASGEPHLTVDRLIQAVRDRIDWESLDTADTLLVTALLDHLRTELTARLGPDILPGDLRLAVDKVAAWVVSAARMTSARNLRPVARNLPPVSARTSCRQVYVWTWIRWSPEWSRRPV